MGRLVALVAAAALVLGAVALRRAIDDDGEGDGDDGVPTAVCATEVAEACERLATDGRIELTAVEPAGRTTDRILAGEGLGADGWLVAGPWPDIADGLDVSGTLAVGEAVVVVRPDRADVLAAACDPLAWPCLERLADRPWTDIDGEQAWGDVRIGVPGIDTTAGLVTVSSAVGDLLGEPGFATNDVVDETADYLRRLARADTEGTTGLEPVESMARTPGSIDVAGALGPEAAGFPETRVVTLPRATTVTVGVTLAGDAGAFDLDGVIDALLDTGWSRAPEGAPRSTNLPEPDVMEGVRTQWRAVGG